MVERLVGAPVVRWHNVELPKVGQLRVDLLGETADGELIHIELQSGPGAASSCKHCSGVFRASL